MTPRSCHRAEIITVLNLKGGVGKTHTAWLLAGVCQERGLRCLCVDLDTQANLTRNLIDEQDRKSGIELLFHPGSEEEASALIRTTRFSAIDAIPSNPALAAFDVSDQKQWEASDLQQSLVDPLETLRGQYDFIFCDCPPRLSLVSFAALCASQYVVIPLEAADWGAQGIVQVTAAVDYVASRHNPRLQLLGYLVSRFKRARSYQRSYLSRLRAHFGPLAFDTVVPDLASFEKSVTLRVPITLHAPASVEAGIARRLFTEVERRVSRCRPSRTRSRHANVPVAGRVAV